MNKGSSLILGVIVILIGVSIISNNFSLLSNNLNDSDSVSLKDITKIIVTGSSENIKIINSNENNLNAELTGRYSGLGFTKPKVDIKKSGKTLTVSIKRPKHQIFSSSELYLDVFISSDYMENLSLDISSGSIDIDDRFDVNTLDIDISSGDILIDEIHSDQTIINVSSGSLLIKSFTGDLTGELSSGDVDINFLEFNNDIKFNASSGSAEITLPKGSDFDFSANKSSGSINVDFELNNHSKSNHNIKGTVGNGGNEINLGVSSGDISIYKR